MNKKKKTKEYIELMLNQFYIILVLSITILNNLVFFSLFSGVYYSGTKKALLYIFMAGFNLLYAIIFYVLNMLELKKQQDRFKKKWK